MMGRDILIQFHFNLSDLNVFKGCSQPLKGKHPDVFTHQVGCLYNYQCTVMQSLNFTIQISIPPEEEF